MKNFILFGFGFLLTQLSHAQLPANLVSSTNGQTQPLRATNSIELSNGFSSVSEIDITIVPPLSATGQWSTAHWGFANQSTTVPNTVFIGIHTSVLPDGMVLSWQGHNDNQYSALGSPHPGTDIYRWDPAINRLITPIFHVDWTNAFCTGHSFLADGKLLVTGGHDRTIGPVMNGGTITFPGYIKGLPHANTYDYTIDPNAIRPNTAHDPLSWHKELEMIRNRWYPTNTTLSNGDVLTTAGETEPSPIVHDYEHYPELFKNGSWTTLTGASKVLPTYPWMFQAPNGKVFYAGPGPDSKYLDPDGTGAWTEMGTQGRTYGRGQGTAAMFGPGKILVAGGSNGSTVTNTTEIIDLNSGAAGPGGYLQPVITAAAAMRHARHHVNSTLLPDGTVLVTGGSRVTGSNDRTQGVLEAEIWNPPAPEGTGAAGTGTWTTVAAMQEARMYHSTAVLLPDGRVLSAGGEEVIDYDPFRPNVNNHCTAEIYSPPYLFDAAGNPRMRPVITGAPAHVGYGQPFTIAATAGSGTLARATLVRLSSVTHSFNQNQRFLPLSVSATAARSLAVTAPGSANDCPPGHYLLFVLNNSGTPSVGQVVQIGASACAAAPLLSAAYTVEPEGCSATATATVAGQFLGTDYRWTINGVYDPAYDGQDAASVLLGPCAPQATLGVSVTPTCGGERVENFISVSKLFSPAHCPCGPAQ